MTESVEKMTVPETWVDKYCDDLFPAAKSTTGQEGEGEWPTLI